MEIYNEEKAIEEHAAIQSPPKESLERSEKKRALEFGREKLGKICYSINSFKEIDENLIGRYSLNEIQAKCHHLNEIIKKYPDDFIEDGIALQDAVGNFEGGLGMLARIYNDAKNEAVLSGSLKNSVTRFDAYLESQIEKILEKQTLH